MTLTTTKENRMPTTDFDATLQVFATIQWRNGEPVGFVIEPIDLSFLIRVDAVGPDAGDRYWSTDGPDCEDDPTYDDDLSDAAPLLEEAALNGYLGRLPLEHA